ncbi:MAG: phosphoribosylanthranilate isomerase [Streptococcus sp.]
MTKVKICGLSTVEAVETAVLAGADYIGFVFAESATSQSRASPGIGKTGDWQDQNCRSLCLTESEDLEQAIGQVSLDMVQIHGTFDEALIPLISVPSFEPSSSVIRKPKQPGGTFLLFDAPVAGSGQTFDWDLLKDQKIQQDFFIAGGLTVDNVRQAREPFSHMHWMSLRCRNRRSQRYRKDKSIYRRSRKHELSTTG